MSTRRDFLKTAALASLFTPGAWFYTLTASLTQPIFDGFLLESQLKQAKGLQLQDLQAYRKAVLSAFADVEKALIALVTVRLNKLLAASSLFQALGGGWTPGGTLVSLQQSNEGEIERR